MSLSAVFSAGIGTTLLVSFGVVLYLRRALHAILFDLCGTQERAYFWRVFSAVIIVLVPLWCALDYRLSSEFAGPALFQITGMLQQALSGLLFALGAVGVVLTVFICRRVPVRSMRAPGLEEHPTH